MRRWTWVVLIAVVGVAVAVDRVLQRREFDALVAASIEAADVVDEWTAARDAFLADLEPSDGYGAGPRNAGRADVFRRLTENRFVGELAAAREAVATTSVLPWHLATSRARAASLAHFGAWTDRLDGVVRSVAAVTVPFPAIPETRAQACGRLHSAVPLGGGAQAGDLDRICAD
jgi:hypothetical protein